MPLVLLVATTVLAHCAFNGGRLAISLQALGLGATPLQVGLMMSLLAALPMALGVPAGRLVDRVGVRCPVTVALVLLVASVAVPAAFPGVPSLFVAAAGAGTGFMLFHIAVQHAVGDGSTAATRKANFGWLALGFAISNFVGPTTAGLSIDAFGHRATFVILACFAATALALFVSQRRRFPHAPHPKPRDASHSTLDLLRNRDLRRVFLVTGLLASAWDLFVFVMPIYGTSIGLSASTIGFIFASFATATFVVRVALPWIQRHLREWTMITLTMAVACLAYALFPLSRAVPLLAAISFLLGLGLGATQPSVMSLIYAAAPEGRGGEAVGVRTVVLNASSTVLPLAFGSLAALGMAPIFWTMSAALAGGGWLANRRRLAVSA